jgi:ankyrin repeat protein
VVRLLLERGADVHLRNGGNSGTANLLAIQYGWIEVLKVLL